MLTKEIPIIFYFNILLKNLQTYNDLYLKTLINQSFGHPPPHLYKKNST